MNDWPIKVIYPLEMMLYQSPFREEFVETFLRRWGSFDAEALGHALDQSEGEERLFSILALGFIPSACERLRRFLHSTIPLERWASAISLGRMKEELAFPILLEMLTEFLPPYEQYRSDGEFEWRYDIWRCHIPSLLMSWQSPILVPFLRTALQKALHVVKAITPGTRKLPQAIYNTQLSEWNRFQDEIVYTLGRLGAFGALVGLEGASAFLSRWIVHLAMGYLHDTYPYVNITQWDQQPELYRDVVALLEQRFGLTKEEQDAYLAYYETEVLMSTLLAFPLEQEWDKTTWLGYND